MPFCGEGMAIINCPECGKHISDQANLCVHCGYPIAEANLTPSTAPHQVEQESKMWGLFGRISKQYEELDTQTRHWIRGIIWKRQYTFGVAGIILFIGLFGYFFLGPWIQQLSQNMYLQRANNLIDDMQTGMDSYVDNNSFRLSLLLLGNSDNGWSPLQMDVASRIGDRVNSLNPPTQYLGTHEKLKKAFQLLNAYAYDQNYYSGSRDTYIEVERNRLFAFNRLMRELRKELADPDAK